MGERATRFYGWTVVGAAFIIATFGWGIGFYGPPIYLEAVRAARGWPLAVVSGAVTSHFLAGVLVVANLPRLHQRFGLPLVTFIGAALLAAGVCGWAFAAATWQLYAATLLSGAGWVALGAAAINAIIAPWFVRKRPAALATAYNGASLGGIVFSPLWVALIAWIGFPLASVAVGALLVACVLIIAATILIHSPRSKGGAADGDEVGASLPGGNPTDACARITTPWRDRAFLTLALAMSLTLFAQIGLIAHLYSLLVPALGSQGAGWAAGLSTGSAIAGRTLVGWLMPQGSERRLIAAASLGVQMTGGVVLLAAAGTHVPLLLLGVILIGLGIGNATSLPPLVAQSEFAREDCGRVIALMVASAQAAYAFAPATFGILRASLPEMAVFIVAILIQCAAIGAYLSGRGAYRRRAAS